MKILKRIMVLCLALSLAFTAYIPAASAKKMKLNKKSISLKVGKTAKLQIKNTKKKVKWSIKSGKKYISLKKKTKKSVVIKAKKAGTAKVVAQVGKKKLICKVKVKKSSGSTDGKSDSKKEDSKKKVTGTPGKNVSLPAGATVFTMGTKQLALGMSGEDVKTVLGTLSNQEIRTGKSPQGFDTIAFNTEDYQEYLLIYLQNNQVVGICGVGKTMSYAGASAGSNDNSLSDWKNLSDYKTDSKQKIVAAKQKVVKVSSELAYAFFDALGDNSIYCIQGFDLSKVKDDEDMIFKTNNLNYDATINASIATEIGHILNAFRAYKSIKLYSFNDGLAKCAQNYCNNAGAKLVSRSGDALVNAMIACGVDPTSYAEGCYYGSADAISYANSMIETEDFYKKLINPTYCYIGVGMAVSSDGKQSYVTADQVDEIS